MCIRNRSKKIDKNSDLIKETLVTFDVLEVVAKSNGDIVAQLENLEKLVEMTSPSGDSDVNKIDEKINKKVVKLRKYLEKDCRKGVFKKSNAKISEIEVLIVERGASNRLSTPNDINDFEIEKGILKRYKGNGGSVVIPNGVEIIGEKAFYCCETVSEVVLSDSVITIRDNAFEQCKSLSTVVLNENLRAIEDSAFYNCGALGTVFVEEGLTTLGHYAFAKCPFLCAIKLPKSLAKVGDKAFFLDGKLNSKAKKRVKKLNAKALK